MLVSFKFQDEKHGNDCKNCRIKTHQKLWQKPWKLQQNKWKKAGDCISRQCSAVLSNAHSATNANVSWVFAGLGWKRRERSLQSITKSIKNCRENNEHLAKHWKNIGNAIYWNAVFFDSFNLKNKGNDCKKLPKPSKTVTKTMKTSAKQMEKGWGLHFSAVLSSAQQCSIYN